MTDSAKFPEVFAELLVEALDLDASRLGGFPVDNPRRI